MRFSGSRSEAPSLATPASASTQGVLESGSDLQSDLVHHEEAGGTSAIPNFDVPPHTYDQIPCIFCLQLMKNEDSSTPKQPASRLRWLIGLGGTLGALRYLLQGQCCFNAMLGASHKFTCDERLVSKGLTKVDDLCE